MKRKTLIIVLLALAAMIALIIKAFLASQSLHPPAAPTPASNVTFSLVDGGKPMLAGYRGRAVLLSFWSVSCKTCIKEIPHLNDLHDTMKDKGLVVIGVDMPYDRPDWTVAFIKRYNMRYPVSFDLRGEIARAFGGIQATPTTVLIDPDGQIAWKRLGELNWQRVTRQIEHLLQQSRTTEPTAQGTPS